MTEAQKSLLHILTLERAACRAIKPHLVPAEMTGGVYARLLELLYRFDEEERDTHAAELLNYFETPDEQRVAADIFKNDINYDGKRELEKALNDNLRAIKRRNIDKQLLEARDDMRKINEMHENKRNIEKLYITISDG